MAESPRQRVPGGKAGSPAGARKSSSTSRPRTPAKRLQSVTEGLDRFIENRIEDVLNRVNIPSRTDIERLNRSVDVLTAKVEALLSRQRGGN